MNKSMIAIGALLALSGCWWDDAPETYQGTATVSLDNGTTLVQDFACDFRAQQVTRRCSFNIQFSGEDMPQDNRVEMDVAIFAHAREEGRYMVTVESPFPDKSWRARLSDHQLMPWDLSQVPEAKTETGEPAFVTTTDGLMNGFSVPVAFHLFNESAGAIQLKWEPVPAASLSS